MKKFFKTLAAVFRANRDSQSQNTFSSMFRTIVRWVQSDNGIVTLLLALGAAVIYMAVGGDPDIITASAVIIGGTAGGKHVSGGPLTTELSQQASPGLLRNDIDERIVKVRPMSTPIDQISRWGGARACGSMKVEYYSVDTKPIVSKLVNEIDAESVTGTSTVSLIVEHPEIFDATETILVPEVEASDRDGNKVGSLVLYVVRGAETANKIEVIPVNNFNDKGQPTIPGMVKGTQLIRMGRAAAELDVQTAQFEALPKKDFNYCQIYKAQVEQSTFQKIANKEVGWGFSDLEESAIVDLRLGMEKNFLFGHRTQIYDPLKKENVYLTGGIWNQTHREFQLPATLDYDSIVAMSRQAFTQNAGSSRKILIGGTALIEQLSKQEHTKVIMAQDKVTRWGIDFTEMVTKFGTLYVVASEIFDQCGHAYDGMIIDPEYITKYCHVPFRTEKLDLRTSGQRNTDAIVITEASCLVLRYPDAHMRIIGYKA